MPYCSPARCVNEWLQDAAGRSRRDFPDGQRRAAWCATVVSPSHGPRRSHELRVCAWGAP